jgi:hypothetical protein
VRERVRQGILADPSNGREAVAAAPRLDPEALAALQPLGDATDRSVVLRHMDSCVATAVGLGVTVGAALSLQASVMDRFATDLARADQELVRALSQLLGIA